MILKPSLHYLSEIEAKLCRPGSQIFFRKSYLKCCRVSFHSMLWIGPYFRLVGSGTITLGQRVAIGSYSRLEIQGQSLQIGNDFLAGSGLTIVTGDHDATTLEPVSKPVWIGDRVFIGVNCTILGGSCIESDVIVGAGSLVKGHLESGYVYSGSPAVKKKKILPRNSAVWSVFQTQ